MSNKLHELWDDIAVCCSLLLPSGYYLYLDMMYVSFLFIFIFCEDIFFPFLGCLHITFRFAQMADLIFV